MQKSESSILPFSRCKACIFLLSVIWLGGLLAGNILAGEIHESCASWMHAVPAHCASIVSMLAASLLPFLFTAVAVYFSLDWTILPLAFCKAFSFGFFSVLSILSYEGCGWLIRFLLLFSDIVSIPILIWLWIRILQGRAIHPYRNIFSCSVASAVVSVFDFLIMSPYLAYLIL